MRFLDAEGEAIAAATVVPLRDVPQPDGSTALEVLMLRRNSTIAFGGTWVFPGGRVDPADEDAAALGDELAAARRAAAREALEEADLLVEPGAMVPLSHWTPPEQGALGSTKRFLTWFFLCRAPVGEAGVVTIDGGEIHEDAWVRPAEMLARRDAGEIQLVPPTWVTLHHLARHATVDDALADAAAREPERFASRILQVPEGDRPLVLAWDGDVAYDGGPVDAPGPRHRLVMAEPAWRYEVDPV
jgi:8-oxo-dGTP pyrophosphatase MutT (NUDIX family)